MITGLGPRGERVRFIAGRWYRDDDTVLPREGPSTKDPNVDYVNDVPHRWDPFAGMKERFLLAMLKGNKP